MVNKTKLFSIRIILIIPKFITNKLKIYRTIIIIKIKLKLYYIVKLFLVFIPLY